MCQQIGGLTAVTYTTIMNKKSIQEIVNYYLGTEGKSSKVIENYNEVRLNPSQPIESVYFSLTFSVTDEEQKIVNLPHFNAYNICYNSKSITVFYSINKVKFEEVKKEYEFFKNWE